MTYFNLPLRLFISRFKAYNDELIGLLSFVSKIGVSSSKKSIILP